MKLRKIIYFQLITLLSVVCLFSIIPQRNAPKFRLASGILPPSNPAANISPNPNFFNQCSNTSLDNSNGCFDSTLLAIDNARAQEGVGVMILPNNFLSLSPQNQLFAAINQERSDRGLAPIVGLTSYLNNQAQIGAISDSDPTIGSGYAFTSYGSIWAGGVGSVLEAVYLWMYDDGPGGPNLDCSTVNSPGCWGHRDVILGTYGCNPCSMGTGYSSTANIAPSFAAILVGDNSGATYSYTYTYQQVVSSLTNPPTFQNISPVFISPSSGGQVTVSGSNLNNALVFFVSNVITSLSADNGNSITFNAPPSSPGYGYIEIITPGGETSSSSLLFYAYPPPSPFNVSAHAGNQSVVLTWQMPQNFSGATVSSFTITPVLNGNPITPIQDNQGNQNYFFVTGLTNGENYSFSVVANNVAGSSSSASTNAVVTPQSGLTPFIAEIIPGSQPENVSMNINIIGINLSGVTNVKFGTAEGTNISVLNDNQVSVTTPALGMSQVGVVATNSSLALNSNQVNYDYTPGSQFVPINPVRVADTRVYQGNIYQDEGQKLSPGNPIMVNFSNYLSQPSTAVVVNITATNTTSNGGFLTAWPNGNTEPNSSVLNWTAGQTVAADATVELGTNNSIEIAVGVGQSDVIVDLQGYYASSNSQAGYYVPIKPIRLADTRLSASNSFQDQGLTLGPSSTDLVSIDGQFGLPSTGIEAGVFEITATNTTSNGGFFTVYPDGQTMPNVSNLNWSSGQTVANRAVVNIGTDGNIRITNALGSADLVVDMVGYFTSQPNAASSLFIPQVPTRVCDTRSTSTQEPLSGTTVGTGSIITINPFYQTTATISSGEIFDAVVGTLTATLTTQWSFLTEYPAGSNIPNSSDLNWSQGGVTVANMVISALGTNNDVSVQNAFGNVAIILDVEGFFVS